MMTTSVTLASLKEALQQPFAPETIRFLPKEIQQEQGRYTCKALPYANKRVYEDRLNELVFGAWSSPYTPPYAQGNKLIIPATVIILGVAHTDYGEAFLETAGKNGNTYEDENTATEAYSQAFRRACARFLLGRYLYDLPAPRLPYNPKTRQIAITPAERVAWVEKLYMECGLKPRSHVVLQPSVAQAATQKQESAPPAVPTISTDQQKAATLKTATVASSPNTSTSSAPKATTSLSQKHMSSTSKEPNQPAQPTHYADDTFLDWVAEQVARDPVRIQGICDFYQVARLAQLHASQREELTRRLRHQARQQQAQPAPATPLSV
jgi:hypothetical protein